MEEILKSLGVSLEKAILEVRYERAFLFEDLGRLNLIVKNLRGDYQHTQRDPNNNALIMINPETKMFTATTADVTTIDSDNPVPFDNFKNRATKAIEGVKKVLEIDQYQRVGLRMMFGKQFPSIEEATAVLRSRFFSQQLVSVNNNILNPQVIFSVSDRSFMLNFNIRPETKVSIEIKNGVGHQSIKHLITVDIDVYKQETMNSGQLNDFINATSDIFIHNLDQIVSIINRG